MQIPINESDLPLSNYERIQAIEEGIREGGRPTPESIQRAMKQMDAVMEKPDELTDLEHSYALTVLDILAGLYGKLGLGDDDAHQR